MIVKLSVAVMKEGRLKVLGKRFVTKDWRKLRH